MHLDQTIKDLVTQASLYFLLAKRYEYVDPQKHMLFYQKHFDTVMQLEQCYMMMDGKDQHSHHMNMMPGQYPMY